MGRLFDDFICGCGTLFGNVLLGLPRLETAPQLLMIDDDLGRRASLSHTLATSGIHVEPFESIVEIAFKWPRSGVILLKDGPGKVRALINSMVENGEWFPLIVFDEEPSISQIVQAVLDGAIDYLAWPFELEELTNALVRAESANFSLRNAIMREASARRQIANLTPRELEVLNGVVNGKSNRIIGEMLSISPRTVEIHRANMLTKLGATTTSEAIRIAIEADVLAAS